MQNAERLSTAAQPSLFGFGFHKCVNKSLDSSWFIERDRISILKSSIILNHSVHPWMEETMKRRGLDLKALRAGCTLTRMVIYPPGSYYARQRHMAKQNGDIDRILHIFLRSSELIIFLRAFWNFDSANSCGRWP